MNSGKEPFDGDHLVTETYRKLGVEKAPEHLNHSVLRMASGGGLRSPARNILFSAWMKPVAWAATIGLSLAIVLELSQVPTAVVPPDLAPAAEPMREEAVVKEVAAQNNDVVEKSESRARLQSGPSRQLISDGELGRSAGTDDDVEVFSREVKSKIDAVATPSQSNERLSPATVEFSATRKRAADIPADSAPNASCSLSMEQSDMADSCDAQTRLSEESWQECIENLRRSGDEEAADREYEAFILKHPVKSRDLEGNK